MTLRDCFLVSDHKNKRLQVIAKRELRYIGSIGPYLNEETQNFAGVWGAACENTDLETVTVYVGEKRRIVKLKLNVKKTMRKVPIPKENDE